MDTNHIKEVMKVIEEKWSKAAKSAEQAADDAGAPVNEAFERGYSAAARGLLGDLHIIKSLLDRGD